MDHAEPIPEGEPSGIILPTGASRPGKLEVVRLAILRWGKVSAQELARRIELEYGVTIQPAIVTVLLGSLQEQENLEASRRRVLEASEGAREPQPATQKKSRRTKRPKE